MNFLKKLVFLFFFLVTLVFFSLSITKSANAVSCGPIKESIIFSHSASGSCAAAQDAAMAKCWQSYSGCQITNQLGVPTTNRVTACSTIPGGAGTGQTGYAASFKYWTCPGSCTSTLNVCGAPPAPTNLKITYQHNGCPSYIGLDWDSTSGATYYTLILNGAAKPPLSTSSYYISPSESGKTYNWNVKACNSSGCGGTASGPNVTAKTCAAPPTTKYSCNSTTHTCSVSTNGTYTSQTSCQTACAAPPTTKYSCNSTTHTCSVSTNGTYTSQTSCQTACAAPSTGGSNPCTGTNYRGGVCSKDKTKLYYCNGSGELSNTTPNPKTCTNGCQVNSGQQDSCKSAPNPNPNPPPTCKDNEKGNPVIDFGNNPTTKNLKKGETATYNFKVKNNNCESKNYTLSVANLPAGASIDSPTDITGVSKGNPKDVSLKIKTSASTPVRKATNPYNLTIKVVSKTNSNKDATSGIQLIVTKATDGPAPTDGPIPTDEPAPTEGPAPTDGPIPTDEPAPTEGPAPTLAPGASALSFIVGLDDIGTTGDNSSSIYPTPVTPPAHLTRTIKVDLFEGTDDETPVYTANGTIAYSSAGSTNGKFTGTVNLPDNFVAGNYVVKITVPGHLTRQIPGIQDIQAGTNTMASVNVVAGDINGNNQLDIRDYSILIGCSILNHTASDTAACNSNADYKLLSDLNDDGTATTPKVNNSDYTIFIREYGVQYGD